MNYNVFIFSLISVILLSSAAFAFSVDVIRVLPDTASINQEVIVTLDAVVNEQEPPTAYIVIENYPSNIEITDCGDCDVWDKEKHEIRWTVFEIRSGLPGIEKIPASSKTLKYAFKSITSGIKLFNGGVISTEDQKVRATKGDFSLTVSEKNTACIPSWTCTDWIPTKCPSNEIQTRTCTDLSNCNANEQKPAEKIDCNYASEDKPDDKTGETPTGFVLSKVLSYLSASYKIIVGIVVIIIIVAVIVYISRHHKMPRRTSFARKKNVRLVFAD